MAYKRTLKEDCPRLTKLQEERKKRGWSQLRLAMESGISQGKIYQLDIGYRVEGTSLDIKSKLARTLDLHVLDLFPEIKTELMKHGILAKKSI